jgi:hypothetical protein
MAEQARLVPTTVVYKVGEDITEEKFNELILKVGDWYAESRPKLKEPNVAARQALDCCLKGVKVSDPSQPWKGVETVPFATRVRIACRYDSERMEPLRTVSESNRIKKEKAVAREQQKRARASEDQNIPDEVRRDLANSAKYGDDPRVFLSTEEQRNWQKLHDDYVKQFPELGTINAAAELNSLCDLLIVSDRHRLKILKGDKVDAFDQKGITDQIVNLKKALGIHPDQLAKRVQSQTGGSIGELVKRLEELPNWREIRDKFWTEELLQIFQMYMTPSPREDLGGYQLDEIGLFGLTRCRTCACSNCGHRNFVGISMDEIEGKLVEDGVLVQIETKKPKALLAAAYVEAAQDTQFIAEQQADAKAFEGTLLDGLTDEAK